MRSTDAVGSIAVDRRSFSGGAAAFALSPAALLLIAALTAGSALFAAQLARDESTPHLPATTLNEQARAAKVASDVVSARVDRLRQDLLAAASVSFMKDAAVRRDSSRLSALTREFRPVFGPDVALAFVLDTDGQVLAVDPPDRSLLRFEEDDLFEDIAREWKPYVSEAFRGTTPGNPPTALVGVPVFAPNGAPAGVLCAALDLSRAASWFAPFANYDDVYLLDRRGRLIARAREPLADVLPDLSEDATVRTAMSGEVLLGLADDPLGGGKKVVASAPVSGTPWSVLVVEDARVAGVQATPTGRDDLTAAAAVALLVAAGALSGVRWLASRSSRSASL